MKSVFRTEREKQNYLFCKECENDSAILVFHSHVELYFIDSIKDKRSVYPFICDTDAVAEIKDYVKKLNECHGNEIKQQGFIYVILGLVAENIVLENFSGSVDASLSSQLLMNRGKYKLAYCAFESGFNSLRTFHRVFYSEFGCTPKEYMKNMVTSISCGEKV